jgi:GNAT superfamily N-acetyltransferase
MQPVARIEIRRIPPSHPDFLSLVKRLDAGLAARDGKDHAFYSQYNATAGLDRAVAAYAGEKPVACGALKAVDATTAEIKRMFTLPECRNQGYAAAVLGELEALAREGGFHRCILETGRRQPEAIALYKKHGYAVIENYGPYAGVENSVCFSKTIDAAGLEA